MLEFSPIERRWTWYWSSVWCRRRGLGDSNSQRRSMTSRTPHYRRRVPVWLPVWTWWTQREVERSGRALWTSEGAASLCASQRPRSQTAFWRKTTARRSSWNAHTRTAEAKNYLQRPTWKTWKNTSYLKKLLYFAFWLLIDTPSPKEIFKQTGGRSERNDANLYGLFRQHLNGTSTGNIGLLYIMPNTSHCNWCGNLNETKNLANGLPSHSAPYIVNLWGNLL